MSKPGKKPIDPTVVHFNRAIRALYGALEELETRAPRVAARIQKSVRKHLDAASATQGRRKANEVRQ